jgi:hypothetical protein
MMRASYGGWAMEQFCSKIWSGQFPRFGQEEFFDKTFETFKSISDR